MQDPILRELPPTPITTERLVIRPARAGDGEAFSAAVEESRAELAEFLDWAAGAPVGDAAEAFMRRRALAFEARAFELPMYTFDKHSGEMIGECGLYGIDWSVPKFGLGYWCRTSRTRQGLTTEAVRAVVDWAFELGALRVELGCFASNTASRAIAEACGFELEGVFRLGRARPDGVPEDRYNHALLR